MFKHYDKSAWSTLIRQSLAKGFNVKTIAGDIGCSPFTMHRHIDTLRREHGAKNTPDLRMRLMEPELRRLAGLSYNAEEIAPKVGLTPTTIRIYLRRLGIPFVTNGRTVFRFDKTGWENDVLPWFKSGKTRLWIAKRKGCSEATVARWLANNGHHRVNERAR